MKPTRVAGTALIVQIVLTVSIALTALAFLTVKIAITALIVQIVLTAINALTA